MSAALAAELGNDDALDDTAPEPSSTDAARFLQVDGADDLSSADEELPGVPAQPPVGLAGFGHTVPQTQSSLPEPHVGVQATVPGAQPHFSNMGSASAASLQPGMPPYLAAAQLPAAPQPGGQSLVPHADTLTAALQKQVSALSRVLGPSEGVRQALQRQMLALQKNNAALQQPGASAALPGSFTAPGMPAQALVYHASSPEQAKHPAAHANVPQPAAQLPEPSALKRTAPNQSKPEGAPKKAKHASAPLVGGTEPVNSAPGSRAPAAQASSQAPAPAAAGGAAAGHTPALSHALDTEAAAQRPLSAGFDSAAEAVAAFGRPTAPAGQPPSGGEAALVTCAGCGARWHIGCLPHEAQQQVMPQCRRRMHLAKYSCGTLCCEQDHSDILAFSTNLICMAS